MLGSLRDLKHQEFKLHVATSKPQVFAERILDHFRLTVFFDKVYGSELDGTRSHKGELIQYIMKMESFPSRSCVMVGDRKHDVAGANENSIPCVGVTYGYGSAQELEEAGAVALCSSPQELLQVLAG